MEWPCHANYKIRGNEREEKKDNIVCSFNLILFWSFSNLHSKEIIQGRRRSVVLRKGILQGRFPLCLLHPFSIERRKRNWYWIDSCQHQKGNERESLFEVEGNSTVKPVCDSSFWITMIFIHALNNRVEKKQGLQSDKKVDPLHSKKDPRRPERSKECLLFSPSSSSSFWQERKE
jgi:hypothetical protein